VRDVLYVEDLVDAFLLARAEMPRVADQAFNIGGGPEQAISLLEVIDMIGHLNGHQPEYEFQDLRPGDQRYYGSDTRKFRNATGWWLRFVPTLEQKTVPLAARISTQGIRKTAAWIERGALDPSVLYMHSFLINELSEAFKLLERRPEGFLKAWIRTAA
jgi:nucleoside-diphosphate-sugar epimerase